MNDDKTITAAIETSNVTALLAAYRKFTSSSGATTDEFFRFITTPTPEREEFLALYALRPLLCPVPLYKLITMHYEFNSKHISVYNRFSRKSHQADYKLQFSSQLHYSSGRPHHLFRKW